MSAGVAVTGVSAFTPFGMGADVLAKALNDGRVAVEAGDSMPGAGAATIRDFDANRFARVRGMQVYPRATQLEICAALHALKDAGHITALPDEPITPLTASVQGPVASPSTPAHDKAGTSLQPLDLGLVTASTFSHMETAIEYDRGLVSLGLQRTNPTLMPIGLPSAPGAATALSIPAKAFCITLSDGGAGGLAALAMGAKLISSGRARVCVVAGAFTIYQELLQSHSHAGLLASAEDYRVLDETAAGIAFGEAAAAIVLELPDEAKKRGHRPLGFVRASASRFAANSEDRATMLALSCAGALRGSHLTPEDVSLACVGANGHGSTDEVHAAALSTSFGSSAGRLCVTAPKANLGESLDPSGLLQCIVALTAMRTHVVPPIPRLKSPRVRGLHYASQSTEIDAGSAIVTATSPTGVCTALISEQGLDCTGKAVQTG